MKPNFLNDAAIVTADIPAPHCDSSRIVRHRRAMNFLEELKRETPKNPTFPSIRPEEDDGYDNSTYSYRDVRAHTKYQDCTIFPSVEIPELKYSEKEEKLEVDNPDFLG